MTSTGRPSAFAVAAAARPPVALRLELSGPEHSPLWLVAGAAPLRARCFFEAAVADLRFCRSRCRSGAGGRRGLGAWAWHETRSREVRDAPPEAESHAVPRRRGPHRPPARGATPRAAEAQVGDGCLEAHPEHEQRGSGHEQEDGRALDGSFKAQGEGGHTSCGDGERRWFPVHGRRGQNQRFLSIRYVTPDCGAWKFMAPAARPFAPRGVSS